jgi:hypothetical protein
MWNEASPDVPNGNRDRASLVIVPLNLLHLLSQANKVRTEQFGGFGG